MKNKTAIKLEHVSKNFLLDNKRVSALKDINLKVNQGEFFIFLGPSGSGKSTLLRIMSGLERDYEGNVKMGDGIRKKDFSFVFQQFALLPWLTVYENVELGLIARNIPKSKKKKIISEELRRLGLDKFENSYPKELSGGMKQRVGIARAIVTNPKVVFMDEPFSALDSFTTEELRKEILDIWKEKKITIIMVTHRIDEAIELSDRIAVLTPRPGHIEGVIANKLLRPRNLRSQNFYKLEDLLYKMIKS